MAIRLRCSDCGRDILVDEAFAGGVCRCPHCKATVPVPEQGGEQPAGRPGTSADRPGEPAVRPRRPARRPRRQTGRAGRPGQRFRRLVIVLLVGLAAVFLAAGGVVIHEHLHGGGSARDAGGGPAQNPFEAMSRPAGSAPRASIADVPLTGKVAYVLDAGASMRDMHDYAAALTLRSIDTLQRGQRFTVILTGEDDERRLAGGYRSRDGESKRAAEDLLMRAVPGGATDIPRALRSAAGGETKPDVIVLLARKGVADPAAAARPVAEAGAQLVTIALDGGEQAEKSLADLAAAGGGQSRSYTRGQLDRWLDRRP